MKTMPLMFALIALAASGSVLSQGGQAAQETRASKSNQANSAKRVIVSDRKDATQKATNPDSPLFVGTPATEKNSGRP